MTSVSWIFRHPPEINQDLYTERKGEFLKCHPTIDIFERQKKEYIVVDKLTDEEKRLLDTFVSDPKFEYIFKLTKSNHVISGRCITKAIRKYAKDNNICYVIDGEKFFVYKEYKKMVDKYTNLLFDPFGRGPEVLYRFGEITVSLSIRKFNFYRWATYNNVFQFVEENLSDIQSFTPKKRPRSEAVKKKNR